MVGVAYGIPIFNEVDYGTKSLVAIKWYVGKQRSQ